MHQAGVSVRRMEGITEALWGYSGILRHGQQAEPEGLQTYRGRVSLRVPGRYRAQAQLGRGNQERLVFWAICIDKDGYRRILGVTEGSKEDKSGWSGFLVHLKQRGLEGVRLVISDACMGLMESVAEYYPEADWQRCMVHFHRNLASLVPSKKVKQVALMLKAIYAQESLQTAREKVTQVVQSLRDMMTKTAADLVENTIEETLTYYRYPQTHWVSIRTNNPLGRIMREIRRHTRVVGTFPDANSTLMLVAARLRHIAGTKWGIRRYLSMEALKKMEIENLATA